MSFNLSMHCDDSEDYLKRPDLYDPHLVESMWYAIIEVDVDEVSRKGLMTGGHWFN